MRVARMDIEQFALRGQLYYRVETETEVLQLCEPLEVGVVLGRCSCLAEEVNVQEVTESGIRVSRRRGGGCAVVIGPGVLLLSYVVRRSRLPAYPVDWAYRVSRLIASCLTSLGVTNLVTHRCGDISIADRKILGSSLYLGKAFMDYGASLLVDLDLDVVSRYLQHPPREPEYRQGRNHKKFLTTLRSEGYVWAVREVALALGPLLFSCMRGASLAEEWLSGEKTVAGLTGLSCFGQ